MHPKETTMKVSYEITSMTQVMIISRKNLAKSGYKQDIK